MIANRGAALSVAGVAAVTMLCTSASAETQGCAEIAARWQAEKADLQTPQVSTLMFVASDNGCAQVVETLLGAGALIEAKDRLGNTPLARAAREGQIDVMRVLLGHGADIGHANLGGASALFLAIEHRHPDAAAVLIERGADPNQPGRSDARPLVVAAFSGDEATAALLLAHGVDPKLVDKTGKPAIVYAAATASIGIVKRLLATGIEINARYDNDLTVLMWAAGHTDDAVAQNGVVLVTMLLDFGAHVDDVDNRGRTALMIAAERGHAEIARLLLARGANPGLRDKSGKSALDLAANVAVREALPPG